MKSTRMKLLACISPVLMTPVLISPFLISPTAHAQVADEREDRGRFYEDDAWYDVSEWFDGNDYNPTDEAIGRWDNEVFEYADAVTSSDEDSDGDWIDSKEFYGEDYDDGYARFTDEDQDNHYETYSRYYDSNSDRLYDSHVTYRDRDRDGTYDEYDFSALTHTAKNAVPASEIESLNGKSHSISGKVADTKVIKRMDRLTHLAQIQGQDGKSMWVDLGMSGLTLQVYKDDQLTATGPVIKRGDKKVLVATNVEIQGKTVAIERNGLRYSGTVESTRKAKVNGNERLVVKLKTENGKKMTVDMGDPANAKSIQEGQQVTVTGVPIQVGDRVILVADDMKKS